MATTIGVRRATTASDMVSAAALWAGDRSLHARDGSGADLRDGGGSFWLDSPGRALFVATSEGIIVGCVGVKNGCDLESVVNEGETIASVWRLAVCPSMRRKGIGSLLLHHAEEFATAGGFFELRLWTVNPEAGKLYARSKYHRLDPLSKVRRTYAKTLRPCNTEPGVDDDGRRVFVGGLPVSMSDDDFTRVLETVVGPGTVLRASISKSAATHGRPSRPRGFGFATLATAEIAASLIGRKLDVGIAVGLPITVSMAAARRRIASE